MDSNEQGRDNVITESMWQTFITESMWPTSARYCGQLLNIVIHVITESMWPTSARCHHIHRINVVNLCKMSPQNQCGQLLQNVITESMCTDILTTLGLI
jgi:hypothetical protein